MKSASNAIYRWFDIKDYEASDLPGMLEESDPVEDAELAVLEVVDDVLHAMEKRAISKTEFANRLGISQSAASQFFRADQNISLFRLAKVASAIGAVFHRPHITLPEEDMEYAKQFLSVTYASRVQASRLEATSNFVISAWGTGGAPFGLVKMEDAAEEHEPSAS